MKTILVPTFDTPLVSFCIANRTGTTVDPVGMEGLLSQTAELCMRGAGELSRTELDEQIDVLGASVGFSLRRDYLALQAGCLHRHLDSLVSLAHAIITRPRFEDDEHEKLRRETLQDLDELRDEDSSLLQRFFTLHCHPGHGYARTALGTADSISRMALADMRALHAGLFSSSDLVLGISGPLSEGEAEAIAARFESSEAPAAALSAAVTGTAETPRGRRLVIVDKPERKQCQVAIGHLVPAYGSREHDLLRVAEAAFGGMFTSRLMQEIRVKHGWSYGASCSMNRARERHSMQLSMAPAAEVCVPALQKMLEMHRQLRDEGLTDEEFEFTRSYLIGSAAFSRATANQRLFRKVQEEIFELPVGYGDDFPERLAACSKAEVNAAVASALQPDDLCVVVVASADQMRAPLEAIGFDDVQVVDYRSY